jgi:hypothetical protein
LDLAETLLKKVQLTEIPSTYGPLAGGPGPAGVRRRLTASLCSDENVIARLPENCIAVPNLIILTKDQCSCVDTAGQLQEPLVGSISWEEHPWHPSE